MTLLAVEEREHFDIPLPDGGKLGARAYFPQINRPVGCVVALQPYQKDGRSRVFTPHAMHRWFAQNGLAAIMVDVRGTGASTGPLGGPFDHQEARDGYDIVEWVAAQPWSNGAVGMWGISYPGLTSLATAALQPPHLKTIVPVHASSDPDGDYVRVRGEEGGYWFTAEWAPRMAAYSLMPPLFRDDDGEWERRWQERLDAAHPWLLDGYAGDDDAGFTDRRPPVNDPSNISCASLHIVGWRDLFAAATLRDWQACSGPKRLIVGPWKHSFPDTDPWDKAPVADEMLEWLLYWLADDQQPSPSHPPTTPPVTYYVQDHGRQSAERGWYGAESFPPTDGRTVLTLSLSTVARGPEAISTKPLVSNVIPSEHVVGLSSLPWDGWTAALDTDRAWDQRTDDVFSLVFASGTLREPLVITGAVTGSIPGVEASRPLALRLVEICRDGRTVLIARGLAQPASPGEEADGVSATPNEWRMEFDSTAYVVPPGHRIAVAITTRDIPMVWPHDLGADTGTIAADEIGLVIPSTAAKQLQPHQFNGTLRTEALQAMEGTTTAMHWRVCEDLVTGAKGVTVEATEDFPLPHDGRCRIVNHYATQASTGPNVGATLTSTTSAQVRQRDETINIVVESSTSADRVDIVATVERNGTVILDRRWGKQRAQA